MYFLPLVSLVQSSFSSISRNGAASFARGAGSLTCDPSATTVLTGRFEASSSPFLSKISPRLAWRTFRIVCFSAAICEYSWCFAT